MNFVGQTVDDQYRIIEEVGSGGLGTVFLAKQIDLDRDVAIKFLHETLIGDDAHLKRFRREGQLLSRVKDPRIVQCYGYGVWQSRYPYLVFEYVSGRTLRHLLQTKRALGADFTLKMSLQLTDALQSALHTGLIHRDLKPENLMIDENGSNTSLKVLDFGLAKFIGPTEGEKLTDTGLLIGSAAYMSPEQCQGKPATPSSDVYSIGCILYECLTGSTPVSGATAVETLFKHVNQLPLAIPEPAAPKELTSIVMKCLAKNPDDRFEDAAQLNLHLQALDAGNPLVLSSSPMPKERRNSGLVLTVAGLAALAFVLTDPGPAPFFAKAMQPWGVAPLESIGDWFSHNKRLHAANEFYASARRSAAQSADRSSEARLKQKLQGCISGSALSRTALPLTSAQLLHELRATVHKGHRDKARELAPLIEKTGASSKEQLCEMNRLAALAFLSNKDLAQSEAYLRQAYACVPLGNSTATQECNLVDAQMAAVKGNYARALKQFEEVREYGKQNSNLVLELSAVQHIAEIHMEKLEFSEAEKLIRMEMQMLAGGTRTGQVEGCEMSLGKCLLAQKRLSEAKQIYLQLETTIEDIPHKAFVLEHIGADLAYFNYLGDASQFYRKAADAYKAALDAENSERCLSRCKELTEQTKHF